MTNYYLNYEPIAGATEPTTSIFKVGRALEEKLPWPDGEPVVKYATDVIELRSHYGDVVTQKAVTEVAQSLNVKLTLTGKQAHWHICVSPLGWGEPLGEDPYVVARRPAPQAQMPPSATASLS